MSTPRQSKNTKRTLRRAAPPAVRRPRRSAKGGTTAGDKVWDRLARRIIRMSAELQGLVGAAMPGQGGELTIAA